MNFEIGIKQEVIKGLASEAGLRRIQEMARQDYMFGAPALTAVKQLSNQLVPLFEVITNPEVLVAAVLEQQMATIIDYLYGVHGARAEKIFGTAIEALQVLQHQDDKKVEYASAINVTLKVLCKILDINTSSQVNPKLHVIVDSINEFLAPLAIDGKYPGDAHEAAMTISKIRRRLGIGSDLPSAATSTGMSVEKAKFAIKRDPPGGRHDNDFENIESIQILPTRGEILSARTEYLPFKDEDDNHLRGLPGLFDKNFRLLREDTVGQLRDAVQVQLQNMNRRDPSKMKSGARTYAYKNLEFKEMTYDKGKVFLCHLSFDQPAKFDNATQRRAWWYTVKRLESDAVVCIIDSRGSILFCNVAAKSKLRHGDHGLDRDTLEAAAQLYKDKHRAFVSLYLSDHSHASIRQLTEWFKKRDSNLQIALVEFPGVILPAFKPTLEALQQMRASSDIALSEYLVPQTATDDAEASMNPPHYATQRGFRFNLRPILKDDIDLFLTPGEPFDLQALQKHSTLDDAQALALYRSLSRDLALVQGPPGTGKSFVGVALIRVLLENKRTEALRAGADLGPIVVVTYTNHALDQTLEHLHAAGVKQIVRMGAGSKSDVLKDCNLREITSKETKTKLEKHCQWESYKEREELELEIKFALAAISDPGTSGFNQYLQSEWPRVFDTLFAESEDEEGFVTVRRTNKNRALEDWAKRGLPNTRAPRSRTALMEADVSSFTIQERFKFLSVAKEHYFSQLSSKLLAHTAANNEVNARMRAIHDDTDLRCLQEANIVGVTTSGLARNMNTFRKLRAQVLVCEEAGEVLEAHILTTFLPSVTHAILIGDHQQLRPQIQNFDLSSASQQGQPYSLDISLFERLIHPTPGLVRLPYCTLETQRRMHPSISRLIRETIYPTLKDADNVYDYPAVVGMRRRLFWFDHSNAEVQTKLSTSKSNDFEVHMTTALVRHIISQGVYEAGDVAVLTPYLGQLQKLRSALGTSHAIVLSDRDEVELANAGFEQMMNPATQGTSDRAVSKTTLLKALRIATVDNFQGEEAKVVILSLVRSNAERKCGFLKTSNRINVALSRAQHGLYIIGDSQTASHNVDMWAKVVAILEEDENIGPSLELQCPRHPDAVMNVTSDDDFARLSPEGGCNLQCVDRLDCGHTCKAKCHSEVLHRAVKCLEACPRSLKGCDHTW